MDRTEYSPSVVSAWLIAHSYCRCVFTLADGPEKVSEKGELSHMDFLHCVCLCQRYP